MNQKTTIDLIFDDWRYLSIYLYRKIVNIGVFSTFFPILFFPLLTSLAIYQIITSTDKPKLAFANYYNMFNSQMGVKIAHNNILSRHLVIIKNQINYRE